MTSLPAHHLKSPRIGVLVNNYNNGPWLRTCLDSVLSQTRSPDEIIVYDDGSIDDSLVILRSYGPAIHLIAGVHNHALTSIECQARAIHYAFEASTADHLYLLDGDDVFSPHKIANYEEAWHRCPDAVLAQAPTSLINELGEFQRDGYETIKHPQNGDFLAGTYQTQDTDLYYSTSALAFRRDYLSQILPLDFSDGIRLGADNRLAAIAPLFGPVVSLTESLTLWRQHDQSLSRQGDQRSPLAGTLRRHRYFNACIRRFGQRPIHLWKNPRYFRQVARKLLPAWISSPFAHNPAGKRPPE